MRLLLFLIALLAGPLVAPDTASPVATCRMTGHVDCHCCVATGKAGSLCGCAPERTERSLVATVAVPAASELLPGRLVPAFPPVAPVVYAVGETPLRVDHTPLPPEQPPRFL